LTATSWVSGSKPNRSSSGEPGNAVLKAIFKVRREKTARALAEEFVEMYGGRFPKAVAVFEAGIEDTLAYLRYPGSHHARIRTMNMLERLFKEVKQRTRVVGGSPMRGAQRL
jgi:putative transposase